jgi:hypothetical protein
LIGVGAAGSSTAVANVNTSIYFSGTTVTAGDFSATSDARFKDVVGRVENAMERLKEIEGVEFYWNQNALDNGISEDRRLQVGLIAQEVEKLYPSLVQSIDDKLSVSYARIVAVLIEAIKELNEKVERLKKE